ncbi:hypothetical protein HHI36_019910 [Cryptolaemus montrouzieri]|uniref:Peroxisomal biogenesis factor 3 n=1 Tax=Cryptolaemus montrouzieri TaxID=559131 RepID=A0ABD2NAA4_9CUCU
MSVFSKIRGFFSRHRNKFIIGGLLVTSSIFLTRYAQQKLKEWQEKEMLEFLERTRKQQHFENIGRTCNQTILNLASSLTEALSKVIDTDKIIADLRTNPEDRVLVWDSLKVLLISKLCCLIYSMSMLVIILRIQLNLIGGYLYKDPSLISTDIQEKYLSITQILLNEGLNKLSVKITEMKQMRLCDIDALFWSLQTTIGESEANPVDKLKDYITLDLGENIDGNDTYNLLIRDTLDLLESDEVKSLTSQCVNRGFIQLANQITDFYVINGDSKTKEYHKEEDFNPKKPLAKLLPILNGILSKNSFPEKLMQQLVTNEKLQIFGANIYESLL